MKIESTNICHLAGLFAAPAETRIRARCHNLAAEMQADPKKQGKEKKPDGDLVSRAFPER